MFSSGTSLVAAAALVYFRLSMNHGGQPIFKPIDLRASFHEDKLVRYSTVLYVAGSASVFSGLFQDSQLQ